MKLARIALVAVVLAAAGGASYYYLWKPKPQAAQKAPTPLAEVGVIEMRRADVPLGLIYAGRVAGFRIVEIRAQVSGIILKREFTEGQKVKQGDVLFRIDPRTYQAVLDRANAQLAQTQATLVQANEQFERIEELTRKQVATAKQLEDARAARDLARAAIQGAQADIQTAKLNIEFSTVRAPISGPTSLTSPPEGSLAQAQQTVLTTMTQLDPAYVNFSTSESEFVELRDLNEARDKPLKPEDIGVTLQSNDGSPDPTKGKLDVSASTVDPRTGTLQIRAIFPNPDGHLLPNQFVRVKLSGVTLQQVFVVPQRAVSQGPQGPFVYVVNEANTGASVRPIKLDREVDGGWAVRGGLNDGEKIVVDGVARMRPGVTIKPVPADLKKPNDKLNAQAADTTPTPASADSKQQAK